MSITKEKSATQRPHFDGWDHGDYKNKMTYYSEDRDMSSPKWDVKQYEITPTPDEDTVPMVFDREDLEAVEEAHTLEEALRAYDSAYSLDEIDSGKQSPQLCAEMLLRICDKFENEMTPEQKEAVALETIAVGHAIGHLADIPAGESIDRTSLKGLTTLAEIMDFVQTYSPEEIASFEDEIRKVAEKIDSRTIIDDAKLEPLSGPIRRALDEFDCLTDEQKKDVPFTAILTKIAYDNLNATEARVLQKMSTATHQRSKEDLASDATGFYPVDDEVDGPHTRVA